jgi:hypothetical protein
MRKFTLSGILFSLIVMSSIKLAAQEGEYYRLAHDTLKYVSPQKCDSLKIRIRYLSGYNLMLMGTDRITKDVCFARFAMYKESNLELEHYYSIVDRYHRHIIIFSGTLVAAIISTTINDSRKNSFTIAFAAITIAGACDIITNGIISLSHLNRAKRIYNNEVSKHCS